MARFLSPDWFAELTVAATVAPAGSGRGETPLVVEISVTGVPQGEVRYQVVVDTEGIRVLAPGAQFREARVTLRSDYSTMSAIASGRLAAIEALSQGRAKLTGDTAALSAKGLALDGRDLVPASVRASTEY
ncbi:MAG TPA: SCP2 sterol-binding domain-containing protein [Acidimicrobiales bacterium]|nr:SCP2 sterol-binding domain-containing protein [Acidimicrobiales bacterium]